MRRNRYTSRIDEEDDDLQQAIGASILNAEDGLLDDTDDDLAPHPHHGGGGLSTSTGRGAGGTRSSGGDTSTSSSKREKREYFDWDAYTDKRSSKASSASGSIVGVENNNNNSQKTSFSDVDTNKKDVPVVAGKDATVVSRKKSQEYFRDKGEDSSECSSKTEGLGSFEANTDSQSLCSSSRVSTSTTGSDATKHDAASIGVSGGCVLTDKASLDNLRQICAAACNDTTTTTSLSSGGGDGGPTTPIDSDAIKNRSSDAVAPESVCDSAATSLQSSTLDLGSTSTLDICCGQADYSLQEQASIDAPNEVFTASHEVCIIDTESNKGKLFSETKSRESVSNAFESFNDDSVVQVNPIQNVTTTIPGPSVDLLADDVSKLKLDEEVRGDHFAKNSSFESKNTLDKSASNDSQETTIAARDHVQDLGTREPVCRPDDAEVKDCNGDDTSKEDAVPPLNTHPTAVPCIPGDAGACGALSLPCEQTPQSKAYV